MFNPNANWSLHSSYVNRCHVCTSKARIYSTRFGAC